MTKRRKRYDGQFKFKVALEAIKEQKTINELGSEYGVHPNQVRDWKKKLMDEGPTVFGRGLTRQLQEQEKREAALYEQIGRLKMEPTFRTLSGKKREFWVSLVYEHRASV